MGNKLKHLIGKHKDTAVKAASIENLRLSKGAYIGSGFNIDIVDLNGREIAKFQISGDGMDKSIDTLIEGIADDLKRWKEILKKEIQTIEDTVG